MLIELAGQMTSRVIEFFQNFDIQRNPWNKSSKTIALEPVIHLSYNMKDIPIQTYIITSRSAALKIQNLIDYLI